MDWRSLHVVYYDERKDALLLEGVRPLLQELAGQVAAASFTRHWRRGPHVRVHFRCGEDTMSTVVRPAADRVVGGFLAHQPSRTRLVPEEQLATHRRLAELEHETGPLMPWRPDNSLHPAPYDHRVEVLGSQEAADLLADFYAGTTELAFRMIEQVAAGRRRAALAFDLMVCAAHALSGIGVTGGFMSFRSHAEAFLTTVPEAQALRSAWDRHYHRHAAALRRRVREVVTTLDERTGEIDFIDEWVSHMRSYRRRGRELLASGRLTMDLPTSLVDRQSGPHLAEVSPYHREAAANPAVVRSLTAEWFVLYRLMLNYTYLHLNRLGVGASERFLLCHLAAHAVEDAHGVSAMEMIKRGPPEPVLDAAGDLP